MAVRRRVVFVVIRICVVVVVVSYLGAWHGMACHGMRCLCGWRRGVSYPCDYTCPVVPLHAVYGRDACPYPWDEDGECEPVEGKRCSCEILRGGLRARGGDRGDFVGICHDVFLFSFLVTYQ